MREKCRRDNLVLSESWQAVSPVIRHSISYVYSISVTEFYGLISHLVGKVCICSLSSFDPRKCTVSKTRCNYCSSIYVLTFIR